MLLIISALAFILISLFVCFLYALLRVGRRADEAEEKIIKIISSGPEMEVNIPPQDRMSAELSIQLDGKNS
jgi:hypothetical protein